MDLLSKFLSELEEGNPTLYRIFDGKLFAQPQSGQLTVMVITNETKFTLDEARSLETKWNEYAKVYGVVPQPLVISGEGRHNMIQTSVFVHPR